jgi:hypothetical protein
VPMVRLGRQARLVLVLLARLDRKVRPALIQQYKDQSDHRAIRVRPASMVPSVQLAPTAQLARPGHKELLARSVPPVRRVQRVSKVPLARMERLVRKAIRAPD